MDTEDGYPTFDEADRALFRIEDARNRDELMKRVLVPGRGMLVAKAIDLMSFDGTWSPKRCRKSPIFMVAVLALTLVGALMSIAADAPKFVPPKGKTLVAIGGSWGNNIEAYTRVTGHRPQGAKFYCPLSGAKAVNYFWHNARNNIPPDGFLVMESSLEETTDEGIRLMGEAIKEFGRPVFADLEGEFETDYRDRPREFVATFRRVHDAWDRMGVKNVAYVWHSFGDLTRARQPRPNFSMDELLAYYPGDEYVDWFGLSHFFPQQEVIDRLIGMARQRGKPVALIEFGHRSPNIWNWDGTWQGWYAPAFSMIESRDIKLLGYENYGDDFNKSKDYLAGIPFANTQMDRMPRDIQQGWGKMMRSKRFASGDPNDRMVPKDQTERPLVPPSRVTRDRDKTTDQPVVIQWKTNDFVGSESDYARVAQQVIDVGMGRLGDFGIGEVGVEVDSISGVKVEVKYMGTFRKHDPNTISGFIIDYHTARGYSKRVALYLGSEVVKGRYSTNPAWGKGSLPDANSALKTTKDYDLDLKRWAPEDWDGRVWFTVILQNTGRNTGLSADLDFRK